MADEKQEWCDNSRRWVIWMALESRYGTCPYNIANSGCIGPGCGYYRMREPTADFKRKERLIREVFSEDKT